MFYKNQNVFIDVMSTQVVFTPNTEKHIYI